MEEATQVQQRTVRNDIAILNNTLDKTLNVIAELIGCAESIEQEKASNVFDSIEIEMTKVIDKSRSILSAIQHISQRL